MAIGDLPPKRLYKYRGFNDYVINMLVADKIYFADPSRFNDPLDTKPTIETDLNVSELESVLVKLHEKRLDTSMSAAAKSVKFRGPKTDEHIKKQIKQQTKALLDKIRYESTDPALTMSDPLSFLLGKNIEKELLLRYNKGIFSLAERGNCPLMWSHYGDEHRGLCIGYSVPGGYEIDVQKVQYGGSRMIKASLVASMLSNVSGARQKVDNTALRTKAPAWKYEREWRLLGDRGEQDSSLELKEVVFGMRCPETVRYIVVKALETRSHPIEFFEITAAPEEFHLSKRRLNREELLNSFPRCLPAIVESFDAYPDPP